MRPNCRQALLALVSVFVYCLCAYSQILRQTPPPSKPSRPPSTTQIVIKTSPDAQVYLDDVFKGQASSGGRLIIENPTSGIHVLRISLPGKKGFEGNVNVVAGQVTNFTAELASLPGSLVVQTSPEATVFLDDSRTGTTDSSGQLALPEVSAGRHRLRVEIVGKKEYQRDITVLSGQATRVEATLAELTGAIGIETSPGALIFLDNEQRGSAGPTGQFSIAEVTPGTHQLRVQAEGKKENRQTFAVKGGQTSSIKAPLAELTGTVQVKTSPGATIFLDNEQRGSADSTGQLSLAEVPVGAHELRVTGAGNKQRQLDISVVADQALNVTVPLADLAGRVLVQSSAGATVFLDNIVQGRTDASGRLALASLPVGSHDFRVAAAGKMDYRREISLAAGQEAILVVPLADLKFTPGVARVNAKDGLGYIWLPPGRFEMGCSHGDSECSAEEKPAHRVILTTGFWIGKTPVTVGAYKRFATASGRQMPPAPNFDDGWSNENMPMVDVGWSDARDYCSWIGGRLPTEAEWEYAARGESAEGRYGNIDDVAWYGKNSQDRAHAVAEKRPNKFGLYDMLGNVWQWVNDWYAESYYQGSPVQDPQGPPAGHGRAVRGGSWNNFVGNVRVSYRTGADPEEGNSSKGFRCGVEVFAP
jgi:formylglycine-generating enzyme required for sulfatase activity